MQNSRVQANRSRTEILKGGTRMPLVEDYSDGVGAVFDALHGKIDLSDVTDDGANQIHRIISSPFVKRLRRIKQLGFVSQNLLSAQHNRYSHALGTIQIMRKLVDRPGVEQALSDALPSVVNLTDNDIFHVSEANGIEK